MSFRKIYAVPKTKTSLAADLVDALLGCEEADPRAEVEQVVKKWVEELALPDSREAMARIVGAVSEVAPAFWDMWEDMEQCGRLKLLRNLVKVQDRAVLRGAEGPRKEMNRIAGAGYGAASSEASKEAESTEATEDMKQAGDLKEPECSRGIEAAKVVGDSEKANCSKEV